jgi:hypothetical protein
MSSCRIPSHFWSQEETCVLHFSFLCFGPNWNKIAEMLPGRTVTQIRQKFNYMNSKLVIPETLYTPLDDINFEDIYKELQNS